MSKKQAIITVTVLLLFLAALLCFARLQDNGQKIELEGGRPVIVSKEPIPSDAPVSPDPEPSQSEVISYDPEETDDPDILEKQGRIRELILNVYALRDFYVTKLHSMEADAKSEYFALPEEERTQENKERSQPGTSTPHTVSKKNVTQRSNRFAVNSESCFWRQTATSHSSTR